MKNALKKELRWFLNKSMTTRKKKEEPIIQGYLKGNLKLNEKIFESNEKSQGSRRIPQDIDNLLWTT